MVITLLESPTEEDWRRCKQRALVTMYGKGTTLPKVPTSKWKRRILAARHSPIRCLRYSFLITDIPSNIATHLCRHVHSQPYVSSLRNDRQTVMDGDEAPRNTPVNMIWDLNAEELMVVANKRLCNLASPKTRDVIRQACILAEAATPELDGLLVPECERHGGRCYEMKGCGKYPTWEED